MADKFTNQDKSDIAEAIDHRIGTLQITQSRQKDSGVKAALAAQIDRYQKLFVKVRQIL